MMKEAFGVLPNGQQASLYTISCGDLTAKISDFGATLVRLYVPGENGKPVDVVLGFDDVNSYDNNPAYIGAIVGRNANRVARGHFLLNGKSCQMDLNDGDNNLHSGKDTFAFRMWQVVRHEEDRITFSIFSPNLDQGLPGNARVQVTYRLEYPSTMRILYDGICDQDTVFNMTSHAYFNMAGHDQPHRAMEQTLMMPARFFNPDHADSIPTGELRSVEGTPMDFRVPKAIGRDLTQDYECLNLQSGYDHNFEVFAAPCAILTDPVSGRSMAISTDCPGIQFYSGNFLDGVQGKDGVCYEKNSGIALEPQFYPDSVNHPEWLQPFVKADEPYHSETTYTFQ